MGLEKHIIKAQIATEATFEYKPRELSIDTSQSAKDFVSAEAHHSTDFKISELIAQQSGISRLEKDAHQDRVNAQVLAALKEVEERAYKEGHELGLIEGAETAFQEHKAVLAEKLASFEALLKRIENLKNSMMIESEASLVRLVFLIAKKIAMRDIAENKEGVLEILKTVVTELQGNETIVVKLSNEDHYFLETLQDKLGARMDKMERVKFETNDRIKSGGCVIETQFGNVDATIDERVDRMWQHLEEKIPKVIPEEKPE